MLELILLILLLTSGALLLGHDDSDRLADEYCRLECVVCQRRPKE